MAFQNTFESVQEIVTDSMSCELVLRWLKLILIVYLMYSGYFKLTKVVIALLAFLDRIHCFSFIV